MSAPILIGIDLGTTKIVAVAVDAKVGDVLARSARNNDANVTSEVGRSRGWSEWNADAIVAAGQSCLADVVKQLGTRARDVVGIGVTGQQHGVLIADGPGKALTPLVNWQDRRGLEVRHGERQSYVQFACERLGENAVERAGCRLQTGFMAVTLVWLEHQQMLPQHGRACFLMDYYASCITGKPPLTDPTCAASAGVLDVRERQWDQESIDSLGLALHLFPEIREATEQVGGLSAESGRLAGLAEGTPVFVPIGDHQASFLGSVADSGVSVLVNVGTGAQVAAYTDGLDFCPPIELRPFPIAGNLLSNVGLPGGWSYRVVADFFQDIGDQFFHRLAEAADDIARFEMMNRLAATVSRGADGLRCTPTFSGTRSDAQATGAFLGISPQNFTAAHVCRAILEGMASCYRAGYEEIVNVLSKRHTQLVGAGNGLRSNPVLVSAVADAFGISICFTRHREEAAVGAAVLAAASSGIFPDLIAASCLVHYEAESLNSQGTSRSK